MVQFKNVVFAVGCAAAISFVIADLDAQAPTAPASNSSPPLVFPREVELEMELQIAKDERDQVLNRYEALQLQAQQLSAIVDQYLGQVQGPRIEKGNASRKGVEQKLIKALGGDPDKGDTWDWRDRALVRKDGTKVPLPKPDDKKPEAKQ